MDRETKALSNGIGNRKSSYGDIIPGLSDQPAHWNPDLISEVLPHLSLNSPSEKALFMKALKRFGITEKELNDSFWKAYADPYVPASGIEFRHLWKHIEADRNKEPEPQYFKRL